MCDVTRRNLLLGTAAVAGIADARAQQSEGAAAADELNKVAVVSDGEYGVPQGLQFGFPVRAKGSGAWEVVEGLGHDEFAKERIRITTEELVAERSEVIDLLR